MPVATCRVSFRDSKGLNHSVSVTAESLNEAAALALHAFRDSTWSEDLPGPEVIFEVTVQAPVQTHQVQLSRLWAWLASAGRSPREQAVKGKLRELLKM